MGSQNTVPNTAIVGSSGLLRLSGRYDNARMNND
jgi:hypothetical protein